MIPRWFQDDSKMMTDRYWWKLEISARLPFDNFRKFSWQKVGWHTLRPAADHITKKSISGFANLTLQQVTFQLFPFLTLLHFFHKLSHDASGGQFSTSTVKMWRTHPHRSHIHLLEYPIPLSQKFLCHKNFRHKVPSQKSRVAISWEPRVIS